MWRRVEWYIVTNFSKELAVSCSKTFLAVYGMIFRKVARLNAIPVGATYLTPNTSVVKPQSIQSNACWIWGSQSCDYEHL
jgi:hypothetical protein